MSVAFKFSNRSRSMLKGVHHDLILVVSRGLLYSEVDFSITEGLRTRERQEKLLADGKSKTMHSKHLHGLAIDVMATGDLDGNKIIDHKDREITWDRAHYLRIAAAMKQAARELDIRIKWGGDFTSFFDGPHFELTA